MSILRVDNFGPSAGGTTYSARGIAKAWVNFNGTGTIAARDSENVSSLTDNSTGQYTINLTSAFGAGEYSVVLAAQQDTGASDVYVSGITAASFGAQFVLPGTSYYDNSVITASAHGDLA